ncbi:MAG TPA: hypothetical protein QGH28_07510, partial [Chloroflexota bacterium]|nr:hypothetical protein [Chloroflexota bacterium]
MRTRVPLHGAPCADHGDDSHVRHRKPPTPLQPSPFPARRRPGQSRHSAAAAANAATRDRPPHPADDPAAPPFRTTSLVDRYERAFQLLAAGDEARGINAFNDALAESETAGLPAI